MPSINYARYSAVTKPVSLAAKIAGYQRRKMFRAFLAVGVAASDTILDVGATSDCTYDHSNYLEACDPYKSKITALGIDQGAAFLRRTHPGTRYVKDDGRSLPFADNSFDYVHSSAVLEHVANSFQETALLPRRGTLHKRACF
jgi:ubiquinone/menaquinone biosynthesis C-methylase UbiE